MRAARQLGWAVPHRSQQQPWAERGGRCSYRECQMSNLGRNLLIAIITAVICGILLYAAIRY